MINTIIKYSLLFILLILLQVLLFNNIQFSGYVNPYVYIMFILLLPFETPSWLLLFLSFLTGFIVDLFTGTPGMHSSATVVAGFVRPFVLRITSPRDGYEAGSYPSMMLYGFKWFIIYTLTVVFIHHTALFFLEVFRFTGFLTTLLRIFLSSLFTVTFILLLEFVRKVR
ncbi:MAG: rod shape-determining protein MreD [Bacteroidetes bacterium]|jgi:rod shape-determining protein MreD|nr:rod shape-determining protein MreD [Bacteroidota bacterium]